MQKGLSGIALASSGATAGFTGTEAAVLDTTMASHPAWERQARPPWKYIKGILAHSGLTRDKIRRNKGSCRTSARPLQWQGPTYFSDIARSRLAPHDLILADSFTQAARQYVPDRCVVHERQLHSTHELRGLGNTSAECGVLCLRLFEDGDIGVSVPPEREEVPVGSARTNRIARQSASPA
jgi:hypothetical protein